MKTMKTKYMILAGTLALFTSCLKDDYNTATGTTSPYATINVVRDLFKGNELTITPDKLGGAEFTHGVVISDKSAGNVQPGTFVIQSTISTPNQLGDLTRGIIIDMGSGANVSYVPGDSLLIDINGATLSRVNGRLTLSGITADQISKKADNRTVVIRAVVLNTLNYNFDHFESTLISVHADVKDYASMATYSGDKALGDNTGPQIYLNTRSEANFASNAVPPNAQFTGIAGYFNSNSSDTAGAKKIISLRNISDVKFESGILYTGFPESFDSPDFTQKASYNITTTANNIDLSTGNWKLQQAILGNTVLRDKFNFPGKQCIRMQQNLTSSAYVQMNFDAPQGASKVTVFYGKYSTDATSTFRLEYSINGGTSWTTVPNSTITDMPEWGSWQATYMVNILVPVRFRINKLGLGTTSPTVKNGRLCIEDFAVYRPK
jgi:hypothetical protein